jgi:plasmid stabilization system protein ParE
VARVRLAGAAYRDLEELLEGIRALSPPAARRTGLAILGKIDLLAQLPEAGRLLERRGAVAYRQTVAGGYVIRYRFDPRQEVIVLSIRYGRRLQPEVDDLQDREQRGPGGESSA